MNNPAFGNCTKHDDVYLEVGARTDAVADAGTSAIHHSSTLLRAATLQTMSFFDVSSVFSI